MVIFFPRFDVYNKVYKVKMINLIYIDKLILCQKI